MKKLFSLLLCLSMVLSLCACGGDKTPTSNNNDISNDTVVINPNTNQNTENSDTSTITLPQVDGTMDFDLSKNYKGAEQLFAFEELNLGYKMALLGTSEYEDANMYFYLIELDDSWKYIYDTYGVMSIDLVDLPDNCLIDSTYENIRYSSDNGIVYDTFSFNREENNNSFLLRIIEQKDGYFDKSTKYYNYAKVDDLSPILCVKEYENDKGYVIKKGQYLKVNCEKEEMNIVAPLYDMNGIFFVNDDCYFISETGITDRNNLTDLIISIKLNRLFNQNEIDELVLGDTFKFYDEKTMELGVFPDGSTLSTEIEKITDDGSMVNLKFTVSNPNSFDNDFINQFQYSIIEFNLNGQTYCVDTY